MATEVTTTEPAGNTKLPVFKSRAFLFTLNQVEKYNELKTQITKLQSCDYFIAAKEIAPTTGHEHIHVYAHFSTPYKLNKKILSIGAHIDICKGSPKQNIQYVKKDGDVLDEIGTAPQQGKTHTVGELKEINDPSILNSYEYRTWLAIKNAPQKIKKSEWNKTVKVIYIFGPSGIGKSTKAYDLAPDEFEEVKYINGFWNGCVDGTGCCIYDDFRDSHMKASEFINFIDYRVHNLNVKGGNVKNKYDLIIITSIQSPHEIYNNVTEEQKTQWLRRMEIVDMNNYDEML